MILSSFVIYIRTMAMSLKQLKFNYGYVCSKNQFKNNMAARTATGSPWCRWQRKLLLQFCSTKVALNKKIRYQKTTWRQWNCHDIRDYTIPNWLEKISAPKLQIKFNRVYIGKTHLVEKFLENKNLPNDWPT